MKLSLHFQDSDSLLGCQVLFLLFFIMVKQSQEQKQKFVDAFQEFSVNHGCIKNFPVKVHLEAIIFLSLFSLLCLNFVHVDKRV